MTVDNLKESDLFGRFYFKCKDTGLHGYYRGIIELWNNVLSKEEWTSSITGYYINQSGEVPNDVEIRLSFFIPYGKFIKLGKFIKNTKMDFCKLVSKKTEKPHEDKIDPMYGADWMNLTFRKYLSMTTALFLSIVNLDGIKKISTIMIILRYRQNKSCYKHLHRLLKNSGYYKSMKLENREWYFKLCDFSDWRHFWINMALGYDMDAIDRSIFNKQSYWKRIEMISKMKIFY